MGYLTPHHKDETWHRSLDSSSNREALRPWRSRAMDASNCGPDTASFGDVNANSLSPRQVLVTRGEDLRDFDIEAGDLRENIVVDGIDAERFVPGARLEIGEVAIRLTFHCEPCKRISHLVPSLKVILNRRGVLGVVVSSGFVAIGDDVTILPNEYPALPERPFDRFCGFIAEVPAGRVVSYRHVTAGMGVASSYMRAIPRYVSQSMSGTVHRVVDSEGGLIESYVPGQLVKLVAEGVEVRTECGLFEERGRSFVDLERYGWNDAALYLR
jgi:alkylated DNA nucleotide flippase Atl1